MRNIVAGTVIVRVQAKAGDGLRDHAFERESVVIGAGEEVLFWMRICDQPGAMRGEFRAEIRALPATQPQFVRLNFRIGAADHFKFKVGRDVHEGNRRFFAEVHGAIASTSFFTAKESKQDGAPRLWT